MTDEVRRQIVELLPRLRRFAYALTGEMERGDDLVQETCVRALSRIDQWEAGTRLDSWMYRIAQNIWFDRARALKVRGETIDIDMAPEVTGDDGRAVTEGRLTLQAVSAAMTKLPNEQRSVVALICIEGLSYKEAAEALEIPIGTVMSRLGWRKPVAELSNETLVAFVDGELDAAGGAVVEAAASRDPGVRGRIEMLRATGRDVLGPLHDDILNAEIPQFLLDTVATAPMVRTSQSAPRASATVTPLRLVQRRPANRWQLPLAYAASLLLAAGWLTTSIILPSGNSLVLEGNSVIAGGVLARALETAPSPTKSTSSFLQQAATVTPRLTFKDKEQRFCREYELTTPSGEAYAGVGCRIGDGRWLVQAHVPATARRDSHTDIASAEAAVGKLVIETMQGDAFGPKEEAAALSSGWR